MSIIVNPHNQHEEKALLAFLNSMNYEYTQADDPLTLSPGQQQEILERDRQYETGEMKVYSLEEVINHFDIKE